MLFVRLTWVFGILQKKLRPLAQILNLAPLNPWTLNPASPQRLGEHNFRNVVTVAVRGLTLSGKPLDGPVVEALRKGMEVGVLEHFKALKMLRMRFRNDSTNVLSCSGPQKPRRKETSCC